MFTLFRRIAIFPEKAMRSGIPLLTLGCFIILIQNTLAQKNNFEAVDALFAEFERRDADYPLGRPGCALAIVQDGALIYRKGYGMADLEHAIPITPESVFYAGSVSKQFVAACILLLQEQSKLDIDDDVRRYVPELPDYGYPITLRHLLHHNSGLRDYLDLWMLSGRDYLDYLPDEAVLDLIIRQKALNFPPGDQYAYSNSGYYLLMTIVERISGQSLKAFAKEYIFDPLSMQSSHFHDDMHHLIPGRAEGYRLADDGTVENLIMRFDLVGSGGLYTTVEDLYRWDQNFYDNRLGKKRQALIDTLQHDGRLNNGRSTGYAFAMINGEYRSLHTISHTGSMGGYRAYYLRFPKQRFSVILLGNFANFTPVPYAQRIADLFLADHFPPRPEVQTRSEVGIPLFHISFTQEELIAAPGAYFSSELDARAQITRHDDELHLQIGYGPDRSLNDWLNSGQGNGIEFQTGTTDSIDAFLLHAMGMKGIRFERIEE